MMASRRACKVTGSTSAGWLMPITMSFGTSLPTPCSTWSPLWGLEEGTIDHAIQLAIATHDLGKLDAQWQRWARAWQRLLYAKKQWSRPYQEQDPSFFFAKTDYDYRSNEQREWQKELSIKRPKHACESVMAGRRLILHSLVVDSIASPNYAVARAVCSAVAHHHTPTAHDYGTTNISKGAKAAV